jgi:hypothetical protein
MAHDSFFPNAIFPLRLDGFSLNIIASYHISERRELRVLKLRMQYWSGKSPKLNFSSQTTIFAIDVLAGNHISERGGDSVSKWC